MAEENLAALKRLYNGLAAGDLAAEASIFDPYLVYLSDPGDPEGLVHYGLERFSGYMRHYAQMWDDMRIEALTYREAENSFVVQARRSGIGKGGGVPVEEVVFHLWTFQGRRAIRLEIFREEPDALEAAGLSE